jgi:geranylgeranyl diphosphate synthase type I
MNPIDALNTFKQKLDPRLKKYLDEKVAEAQEIDPQAAELVRAVRRMVLSGGKRLRPAFMYYGYKAAGGRDEEAIIYTCQAIELLHAYLLIHDDIIDNSDLRRGQPTIHKVFENRIITIEDRNFGVAAAILAGDYASAFAQEILTRAPFDDHAIRRARKILDQLLLEVIAGEFVDVLSGIKPQSSFGEQELILEYKAARYTIVRPLQLGAALANAGDDVFAAFTAYGIPLGKAFQIQDDILGMFGDEETLGKPADSDIKEGKKTYLILKAYEEANDTQKAILDHVVGNKNARDDEIESVRQIVKETGADDFAVETARKLIQEAKTAFENVELEKEAQDYLLGIADYMLNREY